MKSLHIWALLVGLLIVQGCDDPDCTSDLSDTINLSFYKRVENEPDTVFVNKISALGTDSVFVEAKENVRQVQLPVNPGAPEVTFIFNIREYGIDTLVLRYVNGSRLISEECGVELIYSELDYVRSDFDSIRIINRILVKQSNEDIRVYNN